MNTIWNKSCDKEIPFEIAIIANTEEAAPRSPAHDTRRHCCTLHRNGASNTKTATGLAIRVIKTVMARAVGIICGIWCGKESSPNKKNIKI